MEIAKLNPLGRTAKLRAQAKYLKIKPKQGKLANGDYMNKSPKDKKQTCVTCNLKSCEISLVPVSDAAGAAAADDEQHLQMELKCHQCQLMEELDITDENDTVFTLDHFGHVLSATLPSPVTWMWIALLGESIGYLSIMIAVSILMMIAGLSFTGIPDFCGPFKIVSKTHLRIVFYLQIAINIVFVTELIGHAALNKTNIVYQCHWDNFDDVDCADKPPDMCVRYLDFLGNSFIVYLCAIFVNVACIRTIKNKKCSGGACDKCQERERDNESAKESCLGDTLQGCGELWASGIYQKQSHKKVGLKQKWDERSDLNLRVDDKGVGVDDEAKKALKNEKHDLLKNIMRRALKQLSLLGTEDIKSVGFAKLWCETYCSKKARNELNDESSQAGKRLVLFLLVWGFSIAFAGSACIVYWNQFHDTVPDGKFWQLRILFAVLTSLATVAVVYIFCVTLYNISAIYFKAYAAMKICENLQDLLSVELSSVEAWFDLRCYVLGEVLPLFYEVTQPIMSLLVISVFTFCSAWIYQLLAVNNGSADLFFKSILADNVRFVAFGFTLYLIIGTMLILNWVLKPYSEQYGHISIMKKKKTAMLFQYRKAADESVQNAAFDNLLNGRADLKIYDPDEESNPADEKSWADLPKGKMARRMHRDSAMIRGDLDGTVSARQKKYESFIEVYDHLITIMSALNPAPVIVGVELTESKLLAIRSYILGVVALFVGTMFGTYVKEYDELLQN